MTTLAFASQKGGVGKTASAVSLASAFARRGRRVLLVDMDAQGNATSALGLERERDHSIYTVLLEDEPAQAAIVRTAVERLDLLPSSPEMAGAEVQLVPALAREVRLRTSLSTAGAYDLVLVDCPPSLGLLTINALVAAEHVVIPVQCEYLALEGLAQLVATIGAIRARLNPSLSILAIVMTMEDRRNRLSLQVADEVAKHFPDKIARTRIPRSVRLAEAPSHGKPIDLYDASSRATQAYAALARELDGRLANVASAVAAS